MRIQSDCKKQQLRVREEMESLYFELFMQRMNTIDTRIGLSLLVEYISAQTSRLDSTFGDNKHKMIHLRRAVLWHICP